MTDSFLNIIKLGMGNAKSKRKDRLERKKGSSSSVSSGKDARGKVQATRDNDFSLEIQKRWAEDAELKIMRRTIDKDPEMFVLNNLMMCVQFFENYDEEISNIRQTLVSSREAELNARLPSQKHTLIPDVLQQHVAQRLDFTYKMPTFNHTIELLQPIRIYVVFDNIDVTEESYPSPYSCVSETVTYNMQLRPSPRHRGYVQLQRLEVTPPKKTASADDLRIPSAANRRKDDIYSDGDSMYGSKSTRSADGGGAVTAKTKNVRDLGNDDGVFENHRYRSQENLFELPRTKRSIGQSIDGRALRDESSTMKKETDARRGVLRNPGRQGVKTKLLGSANDSPAGSMSSGYRSGNNIDTDSDYSYAQTTYSNTPKTSKSSSDDDGTDISATEIPRQCFKKMEYRADGKIYDARREKKQKRSSKEHILWQAQHSRNYELWYLNGAKFMDYFCQIFTHQLAVPMGFDPDINDSTRGSVIIRNKVEVVEHQGSTSARLETFEIVPCVSAQWPDCAQEWLDRSRRSWPHCDVIQKVKEFGCHMIPEGPAADKAISRYQDLEWQLVFPAAERFLETCLTYSQVRVYLIGLMLHKTFMRPVGLTTSHIKNVLFWLVEEDDRPIKWLENKAGESLMRLLESLYGSISLDEPNIPDFFIKDKNLFQEKSCLLHTQKQLNRIIENPVMYVFHAMENIRHSRKFFPRLDYEELLRILTADVLAVVNPALVPQITRSVGDLSSVEKEYDQVGSFWDNVKQKNGERPKSVPRKPVTIRNLINPQKAKRDGVVEIPIRCASMEPRRLSCLLDFFIKHFIKMAESCHKYEAVTEKMAYVEQAERLSVLLWDHLSHKDAARSHLERLCSLRRQAVNSRLKGKPPPETPRRNPDRPVFARPMNDRYQMAGLEEEIMAASKSDDESEDQHETTSTTSTIRPVTRVLIHEENSDNVDFRSDEHSTTRDKETTTKKRRARILSLGDKSEESYLTETTYI